MSYLFQNFDAAFLLYTVLPGNKNVVYIHDLNWATNIVAINSLAATFLRPSMTVDII